MIHGILLTHMLPYSLQWKGSSTCAKENMSLELFDPLKGLEYPSVLQPWGHATNGACYHICSTAASWGNQNGYQSCLTTVLRWHGAVSGQRVAYGPTSHTKYLHTAYIHTIVTEPCLTFSLCGVQSYLSLQHLLQCRYKNERGCIILINKSGCSKFIKNLHHCGLWW